MAELMLKEECFAVIGAAMEVHRTLGHGFLEPVYQEAFEWEMRQRGIPFIAQHMLRISYKGHQLDKCFIVDFLCFDSIVTEIKALKELATMEQAQVLNYLKASGCRVGLLINSGARGKLEWQRLVL